MSGHATWHWVCLEDEDLAFILDFDPDLPGTKDDLAEFILELQQVIEDGLETA